MTVELIDVCKIIFCFLLPPLAVWLETRRFDLTFWLNVLLTILGWLPGQIHACFVVLVKPRREPVLVATTSTGQPAAVVVPATTAAGTTTAGTATVVHPVATTHPGGVQVVTTK